MEATVCSEKYRHAGSKKGLLSLVQSFIFEAKERVCLLESTEIIDRIKGCWETQNEGWVGRNIYDKAKEVKPGMCYRICDLIKPQGVIKRFLLGQYYH